MPTNNGCLGYNNVAVTAYSLTLLNIGLMEQQPFAFRCLRVMKMFMFCIPSHPLKCILHKQHKCLHYLM